MWSERGKDDRQASHPWVGWHGGEKHISDWVSFYKAGGEKRELGR